MQTLEFLENLELTIRQWNEGRRGQDGWDRYTRRRKWYRDAELVEIPTAEDTAESTSTLTQALENEKNSSNTSGAAADEDTKNLSPSNTSSTRRRRWFGSSKSVSDKGSRNPPVGPTSSPTSTSTTNPTSSPVSRNGKITSATNNSPSTKTASRPISIQSQSRKPSNYSGYASSNSWSRDGSLHGSDTLSVRDKEIVDAQDRLDRWGTRATVGTERAERELGLSDEMNMGLS